MATKKSPRAKVTKVETKVEVTTDELLEKLTRAVCEKYINDPSKPGVLISCLSSSPSKFYVVIQRYLEAYGKQKTNVESATEDTLRGAILLVAGKWNGTGTTARKELRDALDRADAAINFGSRYTDNQR